MSSGAHIARQPVWNMTITMRSPSATARKWQPNWQDSWSPESSGLPQDWSANSVRTGEPPPAVGGYVVLLDGADRPRAIWRTTGLRVGPLNSVDERFAWDEGEGERTREWWLAAHRRFFERRAAEQGFQMHDQIETIFERFEVVWPPEIADFSRSPDDRQAR
jgi:uncharacterized protein YhfF